MAQRLFHGLFTALGSGLNKLLLMSFHIGHNTLQVSQNKFFQDTFADVMCRAKKIISGPVAVVAAGVSVFPLRRSGSFLEIHFVAAISAE